MTTEYVEQVKAQLMAVSEREDRNFIYIDANGDRIFIKGAS